MTLEQVYFLGQTIAAVAIVASLIYLAAQVRQNGITARADVTWRHQQGMRDLLSAVIADPTLAAAWHRIMIEPEGPKLDDVTRTRFLAWMESVLMGMESVFVLRSYGLVDQGIWLRWEATMAWYLQRNLIRRYWNVSRFRFSREFAVYIDGVAARAAATAGPSTPRAGEAAMTSAK